MLSRRPESLDAVNSAGGIPQAVNTSAAVSLRSCTRAGLWVGLDLAGRVFLARRHIGIGPQVGVRYGRDTALFEYVG